MSFILKRWFYEEVEQASDSRNLRRLRDQLVLLRRFLMHPVSSGLPTPMDVSADALSGRR
jgi:hypothetical protein